MIKYDFDPDPKLEPMMKVDSKQENLSSKERVALQVLTKSSKNQWKIIQRSLEGLCPT